MLVSFGVHNALAGGTSVFECLCKCMALCMRVCLCCLPAGQAAVGTGTSARMVFQCVECFLPYIAMADYVVSPVVAGGQECRSLLAPLPRSLKPEHKCSLLESHGLVHMCSGLRSVD